MEYRQTTFTDTDTPAPFADSLPITINITDDTILEGLEHFQVRIVETSDLIRVRIGQRDTVNVYIIDDDSESFVSLVYSPADYLQVILLCDYADIPIAMIVFESFSLYLPTWFRLMCRPPAQRSTEINALQVS